MSGSNAVQPGWNFWKNCKYTDIGVWVEIQCYGKLLKVKIQELMIVRQVKSSLQHQIQILKMEMQMKCLTFEKEECQLRIFMKRGATFSIIFVNSGPLNENYYYNSCLPPKFTILDQYMYLPHGTSLIIFTRTLESFFFSI